MAAEHPFASPEWSIGLRIWLERNGQAVLGPGRLELLQAIDQQRSISAAARLQGMSYRHAWKLVQAMNQAASQPLVSAATGGHQGGGASLTPFGQQVVAAFQELCEQIRASVSALPGPPLAVDGARVSLHVAAAVCLDLVLNQLWADYAGREPRIRVRTIYGASDELAQHIQAGAAVDLFISADQRPLHQLAEGGLIDPASITHLADNTLAAIAAPGLRLKMRSAGDLAQPAIRRVALADPATPLGRYTQLCLQRQGLYESVRKRALVMDNSRAVPAAVRAGQADVGLVYGSDVGSFPDCPMLFRFKDQSVPMSISAAVLRNGRHADDARRLLAFLASPEAARRFDACGFTPRVSL